MTAEELKARLRAFDPNIHMVIGNDAYPVGGWMHAAALYIETLESQLRASLRPITIGELK